MNYQQKLKEMMPRGHYKLNPLLDDTVEKLLHVSSNYEIFPNSILDGCFEGDVDSNQDLGVNNVCNLLTNSHVEQLLSQAKKEIFVNPIKYNQLISSLSQEITSYYTGQENFSLITNFPTMRSQLDSYVRNGDATKFSKKIQNNLVSLLQEFQEDLKFQNMTFHLLGSTRYGDAGEFSDVDTNLISLSAEPRELCQKEHLKGEIESAIDYNLMPNQVRDGMEIIDLSEYQAILIDILNGDTDCEEDYHYNNDLFHPYDWLLQGLNLLETNLEIDHEIAETKNMIIQAATQDPFFEFLLCYKMMPSIQKRQDNLERK